jgi:hypothetical protein
MSKHFIEVKGVVIDQECQVSGARRAYMLISRLRMEDGQFYSNEDVSLSERL